MGVDFAALKARLKKMEDQKNGNYGGDKKKKPKWVPTEGKTDIRIVPMSLVEDYDPIKTLYLIYGIKVDNWNHTILDPKANFGKASPFDELRLELFRQGTPDAKELAKKLFPKDAHLVPIIARGEEELGVRWWGFSKTIYQYLMDKFFDKKWGDMTNPETGRDITVTRILKSGKENFDTINADLSPVQSPLSEDPKQMEEWVDSIPDIYEIYPIQTYEELEKLVSQWFASNQKSADSQEIDVGVDYSSGNSPKSDKPKDEGSHADIDSALDELLGDQ
jgi:hypothetical protein